MKQERTVVVTNQNLYNFHKKSKIFHFFSSSVEIRRHLPIKDLAGLTKSLNEKSAEFVIHVKNDFDYRMETSS